MLLVCFEGLARVSRRVWRRFVRGSREISLVPSLHRASTDALMCITIILRVRLSYTLQHLPFQHIGVGIMATGLLPTRWSNSDIPVVTIYIEDGFG